MPKIAIERPVGRVGGGRQMIEVQYGLLDGEAPAPSTKATAADRRTKKAKRKAARASKRKNR